MRRSVIMGGIWALGVIVSVTLAFAAVGRVASGVAPHDPARLSQTAIDDELTSGKGAQPRPAAPATAPRRTTTTRVPESPEEPGATGETTVTSPGFSPGAAETVTTSEGGTLFTRCSAPQGIVYVAAVPRTGYERTVDVEEANKITQAFETGNHRSTIQASCANGVVVAHVDEVSGPTDD